MLPTSTKKRDDTEGSKMRCERVFESLLGLQGLRVCRVEIAEEGIVIYARRRYRRRTCSGCGRRASGAYDQHTKRWRHLAAFGRKCFVEVESIRRVMCAGCGVRVETVPWARHDSSFTRAFEDAVAWLTRRTNRTAVSRWMEVAWVTVGSIAERIVEELLPESRFDDLYAIGVDQFHYGKKKVMTLVVDHVRGGLIWGGEGQGATTLNQFFDHLGPERAAKIRFVSMDMDAGYTKAVVDRVPDAEIVYDPFHVTQLVNKAVDEVRREEVRGAQAKDAARSVKGLRYALLKGNWNLTRAERSRIRDLQNDNRRLYRAYLIKEAILDVYGFDDPVLAERRLRRAIDWAARSGLKPLKRVSRTIRKNLASILRYIEHGFSNGRLEATCRHMRMLSSRAYGFASSVALLAMGFLFCGNIQVALPWGPG